MYPAQLRLDDKLSSFRGLSGLHVPHESICRLCGEQGVGLLDIQDRISENDRFRAPEEGPEFKINKDFGSADLGRGSTHTKYGPSARQC